MAASLVTPDDRTTFRSAITLVDAGRRSTGAAGAAFLLLALLPPGCRNRPGPPESATSVGYGEAIGAESADAATAFRRQSWPRIPRRAGTTCIIGHVADGDTFTCRNGPRVRLLLIDAPERDQQPFGAESRSAMQRLVPVGSQVRLESDIRPLDRFGRTLAYVYLPDGRMLNEEMASAGYAVTLVYPPNVRYVERIRAAVASARHAGRGLWRVAGFACTPHDHRRRRC